MSEVGKLEATDIAFLEPYLPPPGRLQRINNGDTTERDVTSSQSGDTRLSGDMPFVTLTYASSLDGMISLAPGLRTTLSGPETKSMTHYLRLHHDAILIGVGTAIPDDPSLNCRYPGASFETQPQPIIIDPQRRWDIGSSKLAKLTAEGQSKAPWLFHVGARKPLRDTRTECEHIYVDTEREAPTATDSSAIPWPTIMRTLKQRGINSVMIEGGATVISTLLCMPELVDSVVVTVAPTWLGQGSVSISPAARTTNNTKVNSATLKGTAWRQFGADAVLCGTMRHG